MMPRCQAPIPDGTLLDYWARDLADGDEADRVEERNAGAEAAAIGDVRIVPGVVATGPEGAVVVRGVPLGDPVELTAVGQPQVLAGSLGRAGGPIAQLNARFPDVTIAVVAVDLVTVPATDRDLTPQLARPRL